MVHLLVPREPQRVAQGRLGFRVLIDVVPASAARVEAARDRERFDHRRFARSVLADEERDVRRELHREIRADRRDREGELVHRGVEFLFDARGTQEWHERMVAANGRSTTKRRRIST